MFIPILLIVIGVLILLNAMGIFISANFWGFFWAIVFISIGIKMLMKKGKCPICAGHMWSGRIHERMHGGCCESEGCECEDEQCECEEKK